MLAEIIEDQLIIPEDRSLIPITRCVSGEVFSIVGAFFVQQAARLGDLAAMMDVLDGLLKADCDEETDDDGGDVNEEVAPGAGGVVGRVYVEHKGLDPPGYAGVAILSDGALVSVVAAEQQTSG